MATDNRINAKKHAPTAAIFVFCCTYFIGFIYLLFRFAFFFLLSLFLPIFNFICGYDLGKGGNYYSISGKESTIVAENGAVHLTAYANLRVCLTGFP